MTDRVRRLAGVREAVAPGQASVYHAVAREAALDAFGRAYERGPAPTGDDAPDAGPEYVLASTAEGELLVLAGAWPADGRSCGRLVAPRPLLALLLEDPETTAVWCDEDDGEGLALTAQAITVGAEPMLLVSARSARATGEVAGVTRLAYEEARLDEGEWSPERLAALVQERDGDVIALSPAVIAALARQVGDPDAS